MFAFLAAGAPSFASTPHAMCPEPKLGAQPPVAGVMPGFGHKAHILLGAAPDYPPYTGWAGTVPDDPTTSGFNVEVGLLAEPICGVKIDFIFAPWSECWTAKPESVYFDQATEYVGESLYKGYVHGCTAYTHTKGERNWSLEFTHSILAGLKTGGIITRLVRHCPHQQASAHAVVHCPFCDVWSGTDGRSCIPRRTGRRWQPGRLADDVQLHRHQARRRAGLGAHSWDLRLQQELLRRRRAAVHRGARAHVQKGETPHVGATHTAWRAHGSPKRSLWPFCGPR